MKTYVYVSDTKLDMYYGQIPQNFLKKIAPELGINLGFLNLSLKEKKDDLQGQETTRFKKLGVVTNYIKQNFPVGSIDSPNEYFEGTISMRWGDYMNTGMIYFGGNTDQTWLGLAGSSYHLIGSRPPERIVGIGSTSLAISIEPALKKAIGYDMKRDRHAYGKEYSPYSGRYQQNKNYQRYFEDRPDVSLGLVVRATSAMQGPTGRFEFLARKLKYGKLTRPPTVKIRKYADPQELPYKEGEAILLGTPIYVAEVTGNESSAQKSITML